MTSGVTAQDLVAVEAAFHRALRTGHSGDLKVIGYGEISCVVAVETATGRFACKRLPPFDGRERFEAYRGLFHEYLERLAERGVQVVPSTLREVGADDGSRVAYCVQPILDGGRLGPRVLDGLAANEVEAPFRRLLDLVVAAVSPHVGFDAQLANWVLQDDGWAYLDVTTPLLRDDDGRDRLDSELFLAALPWFLRGLVRRFVLRSITQTYFDPRRVVLDFLANLYKERLQRHVPAFLRIVNPRLDRPLGEREVRSYYRDDARLWRALLALRRLDRFWQLRVRRRPYPFLLPGKIER